MSSEETRLRMEGVVPSVSPVVLRRCRVCAHEFSVEESSCPRCGTALKKEIGWLGLIGAAIVPVIILAAIVPVIVLIALVTAQLQSKSRIRTGDTQYLRIRTGNTQYSSLDVEVKCLNVKRAGGKFRYFFEIRNHGSVPFSGEVTISLKRADGGTTWYENFDIGQPLEPGVATVVSTDANTGPTSAYGEWKITTFEFEAESTDGRSTRGTGSI